MDKPLAELGADRAGVRERHRRITEKHGAPSADNVFRIFRAVYNRGLREHPDLPANPTANVDYHGLRRSKVDSNADKLRAWGKAVLDLHPVRRDLHPRLAGGRTHRRAEVPAEPRGGQRDDGVPEPKP